MVQLLSKTSPRTGDFVISGPGARSAFLACRSGPVPVMISHVADDDQPDTSDEIASGRRSTRAGTGDGDQLITPTRCSSRGPAVVAKPRKVVDADQMAGGRTASTRCSRPGSPTRHDGGARPPAVACGLVNATTRCRRTASPGPKMAAAGMEIPAAATVRPPTPRSIRCRTACERCRTGWRMPRFQRGPPEQAGH